MKESLLRSLEAIIAFVATYMVAVTLVQTTLYNKLLDKVSNYFGPSLDPYLPYINIGIILGVLFLAFTFWRKGDEVWFGRLFNMNMLMFFPAVLDFSTFNWIGLIFNLTPIMGLSGLWVFGVGLLLQVTYLSLRYTVRFRYTRDELEGRGANMEDINAVTRGQVGYLMLLVTLTIVATSIVYLSLPYITEFAADPLSNLPVPHMVIGLLVVVIITITLVYYLRGQED
jgi:hypothetical protein